LVLSDFADPSRDTVYRNLYAIRGKLLSLLYPFKNQINSNNCLLGEYLDTLNSPVGVEANSLYVAIDWLQDIEKRIKASSLKSRPLIFENSQGVLLDETYCLDDYGTYSTVTSRNAVDFLEEYETGHKLATIGVARSYLTRHGAGPFLENFSPDSATIDPSNTEGKFQGKFRTGLWTRKLWEHTIHAAKPDYLAVNHLDVADKPDFMQGEVAIEGHGANILDKKFVKDI
jgi:adenylosuccinate synthase